MSGTTDKDIDQLVEARVQALLDDERVARRLRDVEFQISSESFDIGGGQFIRPDQNFQ